MGELMISSKAGTTLPEALTLTSIIPVSTSENTKSFRFTLLRMKEISKAMHTMPATPITPYLINIFLRSLSRTSFGISLSIIYRYFIIFFVSNLKQHSCQNTNNLIINHKTKRKGVRYRTPCTFLNFCKRTFMIPFYRRRNISPTFGAASSGFILFILYKFFRRIPYFCAMEYIESPLRTT